MVCYVIVFAHMGYCNYNIEVSNSLANPFVLVHNKSSKLDPLLLCACNVKDQFRMCE